MPFFAVIRLATSSCTIKTASLTNWFELINLNIIGEVILYGILPAIRSFFFFLLNKSSRLRSKKSELIKDIEENFCESSSITRESISTVVNSGIRSNIISVSDPSPGPISIKFSSGNGEISSTIFFKMFLSVK